MNSLSTRFPVMMGSNVPADLKLKLQKRIEARWGDRAESYSVLLDRILDHCGQFTDGTPVARFSTIWELGKDILSPKECLDLMAFLCTDYMHLFIPHFTVLDAAGNVHKVSIRDVKDALPAGTHTLPTGEIVQVGEIVIGYMPSFWLEEILKIPA
jgi:hypothetical protein